MPYTHTIIIATYGLGAVKSGGSDMPYTHNNYYNTYGQKWGAVICMPYTHNVPMVWALSKVGGRGGSIAPLAPLSNVSTTAIPYSGFHIEK